MSRMSEQTNEIAKALAAVQFKMKAAIIDKQNPHFRSKYASLNAIRDATIPLLSEHGIAVTQPTDILPSGELVLVTRLMHESGQWIEGAYPIANITDKPQAMGSALTYARRYGLSAICGVVADEDDDGASATDHLSETATQRRHTAPPAATKPAAAPAPRQAPSTASATQEQRTAAQQERRANGTVSASQARKDGSWEALMREVRDCRDKDTLLEWHRVNRSRIEELPRGWQTNFYDEYDQHLAGLSERNLLPAG